MVIKVETRDIGDKVYASIKGVIFRATITDVEIKVLTDNDRKITTLTYFVKVAEGQVRGVKADKVSDSLEDFVADASAWSI